MPPKTRSRHNSNSKDSNTSQSHSQEFIVVEPSKEDVDWYNSKMQSEEMDDISDISSLGRLLKLSINSNLLTQTFVKCVTEESANIKHKLKKVEDDISRIDQYSRKDVAILTGVPYKEEETTEQLVDSVLQHLNATKLQQKLTYKDFSAIHRNVKGKNSRPPSITLKFLRLHEKDLFFSRTHKMILKTKGLNIFHCLCPRMIDEQSLIDEHVETDYVFYSGPAKKFDVKLKCSEYMNYVSSYNDFLTKYEKHECPNYR